MKNKEPFVFGGISSDTIPPNYKPKRKKVPKKNNVVEKVVDYIYLSEGMNCKERVKHDRYFCNNEECRCKFKKQLIKDLKYDINKIIIQEYFTKNKIKSEFTDNILKSHWTGGNSKWSGMIDNFIRNTKFIYDLDLLIEDLKRDKTATETYKCKNRVPDQLYFCKSGKYIEDGKEKKCKCYYSFFTPEQLTHEVMKEWIIKNKDKIKLTKWDRVALTYNWDKLSDKQIKVYNSLLIKCIKYFPIPNLKTRVVKRTKITP